MGLTLIEVVEDREIADVQIVEVGVDHASVRCRPRRLSDSEFCLSDVAP